MKKEEREIGRILIKTHYKSLVVKVEVLILTSCEKHVNIHIPQNYMFKLFPVLLIYKTFNTYSLENEKHKIILVDK